MKCQYLLQTLIASLAVTFLVLLHYKRISLTPHVCLLLVFCLFIFGIICEFFKEKLKKNEWK